jgi:hypothetical protein
MIRRAARFLGSVLTGSPNEIQDPPPSLVLLLEHPLELTRQMALDLASRAWGDSDTRVSVARSRKAGRWIVQVSEAQFGMRSGGGPYRRHGSESNQVRQRAWDRHRAWVEVDYPDGTKVPESEWPTCYKALFLMANDLWGENCLGLYLPVQQVTVPNMGDLIASIHWAARNGTPLPFLHQPQDEDA